MLYSYIYSTIPTLSPYPPSLQPLNYQESFLLSVSIFAYLVICTLQNLKLYRHLASFLFWFDVMHTILVASDTHSLPHLVVNKDFSYISSKFLNKNLSKSTKGFLTYDRTSKQTNRDHNFIYTYIFWVFITGIQGKKVSKWDRVSGLEHKDGLKYASPEIIENFSFCFFL